MLRAEGLSPSVSFLLSMRCFLFCQPFRNRVTTLYRPTVVSNKTLASCGLVLGQARTIEDHYRPYRPKSRPYTFAGIPYVDYILLLTEMTWPVCHRLQLYGSGLIFSSEGLVNGWRLVAHKLAWAWFDVRSTATSIIEQC